MSEVLKLSEFEEIAFKLETHHSIFYKLWEMGEMVFDKEIPTACVKFDKAGNYVSFHFNPEFWESKTSYERLFIICHECLHVWLNHGLRTKNADHPQLVNTALDVVINHMLIDNFGFQRHKISDANELCWIDTVYAENDGEIKTEQTFEYYYNKLVDSPNTNFINCKLVDSHDHLEDVDFDKIVDQLGQDLSEEEKKDISKTIDKHRQKTKDFGKGDRAMMEWEHMIPPTTLKKKKSWFELIKRWATDKGRTDTDAEQWVKTNRRLSLLDTDTGSQLMLPSDNDDYAYDNDKVEMWLYLDVSGSCANLRNDFYCASLTIPQDRIKMRTFCFDTKITEVNLKDKKLISGGGTSFYIIQEHIDRELKHKKKHPVIFVFTDGYGDNVQIKEPKKWHWFIDGGDWCMRQAKGLSDKTCNFYSMENFK